MTNTHTTPAGNKWGAFPVFLAVTLAALGMMVGLRSVGLAIPWAVAIGVFLLQVAVAPKDQVVDERIARRSPLARLFLPLIARNFWVGYLLHAAVLALIAAALSTVVLR